MGLWFLDACARGLRLAVSLVHPEARGKHVESSGSGWRK